MPTDDVPNDGKMMLEFEDGGSYYAVLRTLDNWAVTITTTEGRELGGYVQSNDTGLAIRDAYDGPVQSVITVPYEQIAKIAVL